MRVHIRWMIRRDMPELLAIEQASFPVPWVEEDFITVLRNRNCIGMVAAGSAPHEPILGYMIYELQKTALNLFTMAVHPDHRRRYIGRQMIYKLQSKLNSHRRTHLTMEVSEQNLDGQRFLKAMGFKATHVVKDTLMSRRPSSTETDGTGLFASQIYSSPNSAVLDELLDRLLDRDPRDNSYHFEYEYQEPQYGRADHRGVWLGSAPSEQALSDLTTPGWRE